MVKTIEGYGETESRGSDMIIYWGMLTSVLNTLTF